MKKNKLLFALMISIIIIYVLTIYVPKAVNDYKVRNAKVIVSLKDDLKTTFNSDVNVSDFIESINGTIENDYSIDTTAVGKVQVDFKYINDEGILIPFSYELEVVDNTAPIIWLGSTYTVGKDYSGNLADNIMCADDTDDEPDCKVVGDYDTKKVGNYKLEFVAKDRYGNENVHDFTLKVINPVKSSNSESSSKGIEFSDFYDKYKTGSTKLGIDVSFWQGDIDFKKVKDAGVEFAILRVGSKNSKNEHFLDNKFVQNIEGFNNVDIPVGVYYYSYTNDKNNSVEDAKWVIDSIKNYKVDLPVFFDWENWSNYNSYHLSLYNLSNNAKVFLDAVNAAGYKGALYSSKTYLENIWYDIGYPVWLAHYTSKTNYNGDYNYWQVCNNGIVDGIDGYVDLNVMYEGGSYE